MKKFEIHLDALATTVAVFIVGLCFILYQRYQYSDLLQENVDLRWEVENLKANIEFKTLLLDGCREKKDSNSNENPETKEKTLPNETIEQ